MSVNHARARAALLGYPYTDTSALAPLPLAETRTQEATPPAPVIPQNAHAVLFEAITGRDPAVSGAHARLRAAITGGRA